MKITIQNYKLEEIGTAQSVTISAQDQIGYYYISAIRMLLPEDNLNHIFHESISIHNQKHPIHLIMEFGNKTLTISNAWISSYDNLSLSDEYAIFEGVELQAESILWA